MDTDRRKFSRYQVKPHTIFLYSNYSPVQGWIKDISQEGMAFEYVLKNECEPKPEIRLILAGDAFSFYISELSCKTMYDIELNKNDRSSEGGGIHRCGVKYKKLDPDMQEKLIFLLSSKNILQGI